MRRPGPSSNVPTIVTLLSDFGTTDSYVAEMKGVLLAHCPTARLVDVSHQVAPQDVLAASFLLERTLRVFPKGTIHVAVVDPGVGTDRKLLLVEIKGQTVFCPDNGLITWPWRRLPNAATAYELTWPPTWQSCTFHGRDILAPAAGMLASGQMFQSDLVGAAVSPVFLEVAPAEAKAKRAVVIHVDRFGNATTNVPGEHLTYPEPKGVRVGRKSIGPVRKTYADVAEGKALALVGSSGMLEIAVRNGSAAEVLGLKVGSGVGVEY